MANEVVVTTLLGNDGDPVEAIVAAGTAIAKGTIMRISASPKTVIKATTDGQFFLGVTRDEKTATDGKTKISLLTHFIGEFTADTGEMTLGQPQKIEGANAITDADNNTITNREEVVGLALETVGVTARGAVLIFK